MKAAKRLPKSNEGGSGPSAQTLEGKRVLLIISGGIAAYKALELIRLIKKAGGLVRCILTSGGERFVTALSVASLSGDHCYTDLWSLKDETEMGHIRLSREADLIVVAPASADIIAKMAHGMADDLATTTLLAANKPVLIAPAMNHAMWANLAVQANVTLLNERNIYQIGPEEGEMACNEYGMGRMAEPSEIFQAILTLAQTADFSLTAPWRIEGEKAPSTLSSPSSISSSFEKIMRVKGQPLKGLKALVTSGPTHEPIDPVRYIGNRSSGKQGHAIAAALEAAGAYVTVISGPVTLPDPVSVQTVHVETAAEMLEACRIALPTDIVVCAAAVADWSSTNVSTQKIKKQGRHPPPAIKLKENPDILATLARAMTGRPRLVIGFAAETQDVIKNATAKRKAKNCDWILANDVSNGVFGADDNHIHLIEAAATADWGLLSKENIAIRLAEHIAAHFAALKDTAQ